MEFIKTIRDTSKKVALKMYNLIDIKYLKKNSTLKILEPSCGIGNLMDNIIEFFAEDDIITMLELNKDKFDIVKEKYKEHNVKFIHGDFLKHNFEEKFDLIIACPPFNNNIDLIHIQKMYDLLEDGGQIVSLTSPYWLTNNEGHQIAFRKWLVENKINYSLVMLPDYSFVEKYKTVPTAIISILK